MAKKPKTPVRYGFLHSEQDISYFIAYVMTLLPGPISYSDLLDICLIDEAFGFFEFQVQFDLLVERGVIHKDERFDPPLFLGTASCRDNVEELLNSLPKSAVDKAKQAVARVMTKVRRKASLQKSFTENNDGSFTVNVAIGEKGETSFMVETVVFGKENVSKIMSNFDAHAEDYYRMFVTQLLEFPKGEKI